MENLYNVLKPHESEIIQIAKVGKLSLGGPLTLMSKVNAKEFEVGSAEEDKLEEERFSVQL